MADPHHIEETLLGGPLRYTRKEVEALSEVPDDYARRVWQALGFPAPPNDEVAFTDGDVAALREIRQLLGTDLVDEEMVVQLARAVGQTMGRLASWLGDVWLQRLGELPPDEALASDLVAVALTATDELRPAFERLLLHGWRRQLTAVGMRAAATTAAAQSDPAAGIAHLAVGFADVVSFTRLSSRLDGDALGAFIERFEATTAEVIAEGGGRVIKTLGDEVLFVASDPCAAADIGLRIAARFNADPGSPKVRVGLAYGEVIQRLGDVFGTPVNLAARLTATAHPGAVLIDGGLAAMLPATTYDVSGLRPRPLQGLGRVRPFVLRHPRTRL